MVYICHMHKCLDLHLWGKYANMYATWEVTVIKTVVCRKCSVISLHMHTYWIINFLLGTPDQKDIDLLKQQVKELYEKQVHQEEILNDIISVANISRGLINQNIMKINDIMISPLFTARRFLFLHLEFLIHHSRVQELTKQLQNDITLTRQYLDVHSTGSWHLSWVDPHHLRKELMKINNQLPTSLSLPQDPTTNIWHYYKFRTVTPIIQDDKLIMMIRIPLSDLDSNMILFKIYNLPIYNHDTGKSLKYRLEGNNLAVTKGQKYFAILSESNFIRCTMAAGHFCNIDNALYHVDSSTCCLPAMYSKRWYVNQ